MSQTPRNTRAKMLQPHYVHESGGPGVTLRARFISCLWEPPWNGITESPGWKRSSRSLSPTHALTPPQLNHGTECHMQSFLNTSRDGDSPTSPGRRFQYFITLTVKNFFLTSKLNFPWCSLRLCPLVLGLEVWRELETEAGITSRSFQYWQGHFFACLC